MYLGSQALTLQIQFQELFTKIFCNLKVIRNTDRIQRKNFDRIQRKISEFWQDLPGIDTIISEHVPEIYEWLEGLWTQSNYALYLERRFPYLVHT